MGADKNSSKSGGGGYVGGFLQLFDWNGKSRKKLLAKSQEGAKQGKRNVANLPTSRWTRTKMGLQVLEEVVIIAVPLQ